MRLEEIHNLMDKGQFSQAHSALEELLSLGPSNLGALKLEAFLLAYEGRFVEEARIWQKIAAIDSEEEAAIKYFDRSFVEEREHEYFTDILPSGSVRFLSNPRAIVNHSFLGLMGCLVFLAISNFSHQNLFLENQWVTLSLFVVLVISPWILILITFFRTLQDVVISREGVLIHTRIRKYELSWQNIEAFYIAHRLPPHSPVLAIVLVPKEAKDPIITIEIGETSAIRAPSYFVREISRVFHEPQYVAWETLNLDGRPILVF